MRIDCNDNTVDSQKHKKRLTEQAGNGNNDLFFICPNLQSFATFLTIAEKKHEKPVYETLNLHFQTSLKSRKIISQVTISFSWLPEQLQRTCILIRMVLGC